MSVTECGGGAVRSKTSRAEGRASLGASARRTEPSQRARRIRILCLAFAGYLAVSIVVWWQAWSTHPTSVTTCGCDDPALFMWFLEWPAYALAHGHQPFYSSAMFHPTGIDILSNTSVLGIGIPLIPVTWLFGPVATFNVASTLSPALTALAMFWLLTRWVRWSPAAFVGGLAFAFAPVSFDNLPSGHLMSGFLALFPLMIACFDELLVRQRRNPHLVGACLAVLVALQFFVGTEMLAIALLCAVVGVVLVIGYALAYRPSEIALRAPHALRGLGVAAILVVVVLAYPVWFALAGPAHFSGLVWPNIRPGSGGITLASLVHLDPLEPRAIRLFVGYQGPALPGINYVGAGILIVVIGGLILWWRDRRLWFFFGLGLATTVLALGSSPHYWTPWRIVARLPVIKNVIPGRMMAVVILCLVVMAAIVVDRVDGWAGRRWAGRAAGRWGIGRSPRHGSVGDSGLGSAAGIAGRVLAGSLALAVAALAFVPMGLAIGDNVPLTARPVAIPRWFSTVGAHLAPGQVVLVIPPPNSAGSVTFWQATDSLQYAIPIGDGPGSIPACAGKERAGLEVIEQASAAFTTLKPPTQGDVEAVREALAGWGVTSVVVPDPEGITPPGSVTVSTAWALGLMTLAVGRTPQRQDGAWVWADVARPGERRVISSEDFSSCTAQAVSETAPEAVPECIYRRSQ